jgi:hypothetical protein
MYYAINVKLYSGQEDVWWSGSIGPGIFELDTSPQVLHPLDRRLCGL